MITRHEMVILKRAQRKLFDLAQLAEKQERMSTAKQLDEESAVLRKVISYFEDVQKMRK